MTAGGPLDVEFPLHASGLMDRSHSGVVGPERAKHGEPRHPKRVREREGRQRKPQSPSRSTPR
jgi:hypothetical protein